MKKLLLLIPFLLIGCTWKYDNYTPPKYEVAFNNPNITKTVVEGNVLPSNFGVYGYIKESTNVTAGYIMRNAEYKPDGTSDTKYYWPHADNTNDINARFVAYFPYNGSNTLSGDNFIYNISATGTTATTSTDVLYAITNNAHPIRNNRTNAIDTTARVGLTFHHALSLLQFQARKADYVSSVTITSIAFDSELVTDGTLTINTKNDDLTASVVPGTNTAIMNFAAQNTTLTDSYQILSNAIVVPQDIPSNVTITFNITLENTGGDSITYTGRTITASLTGNDDNNKAYTNWLAGHKYVYRIYVTADDVRFDVSVDGWTVDWWQIWDHDTSTASVDVF